MSRFSLEDALKELEASDYKVAEASRKYDDSVARHLEQDRLSRFKRHRADGCDPENCEYRH